MFKHKLTPFPAIFLFCLALFALIPDCDGCSGAVITGAASDNGRPLLWKSRDTMDNPSNKVVFVDEKPFSYIGLANLEDLSGRRVWAGLNSAGLAIINTVAYNIPLEEGEAKDLEGWIMSDALRSCATAGDFEAYLKKNLGKHLGSQANFGVIDAEGGAAIFEVHNKGYKRLDADAVKEKYLPVTNFSRSGKENKGKGYIRFDRLTSLMKASQTGKYSLSDILGFARDLGNPMLGSGLLADSLMPATSPFFIHTSHTIDRAATASAVVFQGVNKGQAPSEAVMWVMLGEPVCSIASPLWVVSGQIPDEFQGGIHAPITVEAMRLKALLRPFRDDERAEYLDLYRLRNSAGTGWLPRMITAEKTIIQNTGEFLKTDPGAKQKSVFQKKMAGEVLRVLKEIK